MRSGGGGRKATGDDDGERTTTTFFFFFFFIIFVFLFSFLSFSSYDSAIFKEMVLVTVVRGVEKVGAPVVASAVADHGKKKKKTLARRRPACHFFDFNSASKEAFFTFIAPFVVVLFVLRIFVTRREREREVAN